MADNTSVQVRPLVASDRDRWGVLWTGYLDYYETTLPPRFTTFISTVCWATTRVIIPVWWPKWMASWWG